MLLLFARKQRRRRLHLDFKFVYGEIKPSAISCLAFKWQEPRAPGCGDAASTLRAWWGVCARYLPGQRGTASSHPLRTDVTS